MQEIKKKVRWKYGFLSPEGKFFERYSRHEEWAGEYVTEHKLWSEYTKWDKFANGCAEFLVHEKKWVLLHNPCGGKPTVSCCGRQITKKQNDFLLAYFGNDDWVEFNY
jgi:hypothetical protein